MCGLTGLFGNKLGVNDSQALNLLLHFDTIRGDHSTGVAVVGNNNTTEVYKEVGPPPYLYHKFPDKFTKGKLNLLNTQAVIGHNRWATQGAVTAENAHPFNFTNVVGAHNGTVLQYSLKDLDGYKQYFIDSQIIYSHLDNHPIQEVWDVANGALALTWWDKKTSTINLARNKERPLHFVFSEDHTKMYWASESWMLWLSCSKSGIKIEKDIVEVKEDTHYIFSLNNGKVEVNTVKLNPFKLPPIITHMRPYTTQVGSTGGDNKKKMAVRYDQSFFLEEWRTLIQGQDGKPWQGYFLGATLDNEPIKIFVPSVTDEIRGIIVEVEDGLHWSLYLTKNANIKWTKTGGLCYNTVWADIELDYSYETSTTRNIYGQTIDAQTYHKLVQDGCQRCLVPITWAMRDKIEWTSANTCLCEVCSIAESKKYQVKKLPSVVKIPGVGYVEESVYSTYTQRGCCQCGNDVSWAEKDKVSWSNTKDGLRVCCPTCSGSYN